MIYLSWILAVLAVVVLLIAALGVYRLTDALSRQHAATKAATLGISLFCVGLMLYAAASDWGAGWSLRLLALLAFLALTLPLASHALARAAVHESSE